MKVCMLGLCVFVRLMSDSSSELALNHAQSNPSPSLPSFVHLLRPADVCVLSVLGLSTSHRGLMEETKDVVQSLNNNQWKLLLFFVPVDELCVCPGQAALAVEATVRRVEDVLEKLHEKLNHTLVHVVVWGGRVDGRVCECEEGVAGADTQEDHRLERAIIMAKIQLQSMAPEVERQSLTGSNPPHAGSGLGTKQTSLLGLLLEYRGLSWSIGGDEDLSTVTAFANILRNFNPSLTSFSTGMGSATTKQAFLNQASPAAMSQHLPSQTRALITRMKSDSRIDFQNDWKVITLFIGANDLCAFCTDPVFYSADNFMRNIREALDMLQHEVPRALVNLMELVNIGLARQLLQDCSLSCPTWMLRFECPCLMRTLDRSSELQAFTEMFEAYQASESQVCVRTRCGEQKVMNTARFPVGLGSPSGLGGFMLVFACD